MEIKELLRDLKLNKYESIAYEIIIKKGVTEASIISKEGNIPFGKIYDSLGSLFVKGLIEIQNTRPKKYKIKNPRTAFQNILNRKTVESEEELKSLKKNIIQIEEEISKINIRESKEKIFWTTAIGSEIERMMDSIFSEAKKEIYMIPYVINKSNQTKSALLNLPARIKEIDKAAKRGIKIKAILPEEFVQTQVKIFKKMKIFERILRSIEIKTLGGMSPEPFTVMDTNKVILRVNDPINQNKILAMIKITDRELYENLRKKFDEMWEIAKPIKEN